MLFGPFDGPAVAKVLPLQQKELFRQQTGEAAEHRVGHFSLDFYKLEDGVETPIGTAVVSSSSRNR